MANLIVIRLVPQSPVDANTFATYLSALGGLQITAFDLSYGNPTSGVNVGTAVFIAPGGGTPSPTAPVLNPGGGFVLTPPQYAAGITNGIVQQFDLMPSQMIGLNVESQFFQAESVATAVIQVAPGGFENLKLEVQWGSGAGAQAIPMTLEYFDVALAPVTADPNQWAGLAPSLYLQLPAPPVAATGTSLTLPKDGTPPSFDSLLAAVKGVLAQDPGGALPDLGTLTTEQSRNLAYEIVWSQQKPLPVAPDPIENLYSNPPNNGNFLNGTTPNQNEADRRQFEANLQSYYALADATADRLANFVFSLTAAVACEKLSLAAPQVSLQFPVDPGVPSDPAVNDPEVILTGVGGATSFGVPAAYFYALAALMPAQISAQQRYRLATSDAMAHVLAELTTSINGGVVSDAETFVSSAAPSIDAAQAARRLGVLSVSSASTNPKLALTPTLQPPITEWLAFGSAAPTPSSQSYQPGDDDTVLWPAAATANPEGFLELLLCVVTDGYLIPAPTSALLSTEIIQLLLTPLAGGAPTVDTLKAVTDAEWSGFFQQHPTWLPPFTKPGNLAAQTAAFVHYLEQYFPVPAAGAPSIITLLTSAATVASPVLTFVSTAGIFAGMSVSGAGVPAGTTVLAPVTATTVTLSVAVTVAANTNITFTPNYVSGAAGSLPLLEAPSKDWLALGLAAYGGFAFGTAINLTQLQGAVEAVFSTDISAQKWLFQALSTIANLYQILAGVVPTSTDPQAYTFSLAEALYARGFRSAASITLLSASDFQEALIGTIAYDYGADLYASASAISPPAVVAGSGGGFVPVNPDGSLTNCIPPECRSPLGPVAYLNELLRLSPESTCDAPFPAGVSLVTSADTPAGAVLPFAATAGVSMGMLVTGANIPAGSVVSGLSATSVTMSNPVSADVPSGTAVEFAVAAMELAVASRRGALATLVASCANLETPLPLIDLVNECLEFMGSEAPPAGGIVYDTSADALAGHTLCQEQCEEKKDCSEPDRIFAALPEYSTPATPIAANGSVEPEVFNKLKVDFSACCLPYSQALDVSRTYLRRFKSCRFEEMRTFRKCITEFVLDPENQPAGFQAQVWRYPVRIDTAIEYLGITPEEYWMLFGGVTPKACGEAQQEGQDRGESLQGVPPWELYGFASAGDNLPWTTVVTNLSEFLTRTCLSYCEFLELWKCSPVAFNGRGQRETTGFPDCEPCCLDELVLIFPEAPGAEQSLYKLAVFIRLWRKLKEVCGAEYTFCQLHDICDVLQLFPGGAVNPDFIRQLAAFQMLRDVFRMPLGERSDKSAPGAIDAERTYLLALWAGPAATKWTWAVEELVEHIAHHAVRHHGCERRSPEFLKILVSNLDSLSELAGFSLVATDTWHAQPTHTLRFAEVLSKIYASDFTIGELMYLFTAEVHLDGDDPFPLPDENESHDLPFDLPEEDAKHSLWALRRKLLEVHVEEEDLKRWTWKRIEASLRTDFNFADAAITGLGAHFFPGELTQAGYLVDGEARRFYSALPVAATVAQMWNTPPDGPFQYDAGSGRLFTQVPLSDREMIHKLTHVRPLQAQEQGAAQDLYFQPRAALAAFALLFGDFAAAQRHMVEEDEEGERWSYFRRQFVLCHRRCLLIAEHLSSHVAAATGRPCPEGSHEALLLLRGLFADENKATADWENDVGTTPPVTWAPPPIGGAFAALLGLVGTGLIAEYTPCGGALAWRDVGRGLSVLDHERDKENCPVPTIVPAMDLTLTAPQMQFLSVLNGFAMKDATGAWLGGAQGFDVRWSGALLIEREGSYEFFAGLPEGEKERPHWEDTGGRRWRITLKRGQRSWVLLAHRWPETEGRHRTELQLRSGAYEVTLELMQPAPSFHDDIEVRDLRTGLQVRYSGPDTDGQTIEVPHERLFSISKEDRLDKGIATLGAGAAAYLQTLYVSSLRDIRRTYQRAFKALLLVHRFKLSANPVSPGQSELGYMLQQKDRFAGAAFFRSAGSFTEHQAGFDFNFLPLLDNFLPPAGDHRTNPSPQREQAMFDGWERLFDYVRARKEVRRRCERHLWLLFDEAFEKQPAHPEYLLRHMGADSRHWEADMHFYEDQFAPVYQVTRGDVEDERWVLRAFHADAWMRSLGEDFHAKDITLARPDLWASADPSALVGPETETGNANLSAFLCDGCFENGDPRRYDEVRRLNDGLRERGRDALVCYLCHMDRVPLPWLPAGEFATMARDLSDVLLLDVEAGVCERTTRIDEAISAVQTFVRRARLDLEPGWRCTREFMRLWERQFATFRIWQACKRRQMYKENYIEWGELEKARRVEAFCFLEAKLKSCSLTAAVPGGLEWWPEGETIAAHPGLPALGQREPAELRALPPQPGSQTREGLNLLGSPERAARPSWLAAVPLVAQGGNGNNGNAIAGRALAAGGAGSAAGSGGEEMPLWMEAAVGLGTRFYRIAAADAPPAAAEFGPCECGEGEICVQCCAATCCSHCGKLHPPLVDEYYFWLVEDGYFVPPVANTSFATTEAHDYQNGYQNDYYDPSQQQSAYWQDISQLPQLLEWNASPMVKLAWCRVHNREFQQPRRSVFGVPVLSVKNADLLYVGRTSDSLTLSVSNPSQIAPPGYLDPSAPGFRYDIAEDEVVVLPLVSAATPGGPYLGGLPAYPYFLYDCPGAPVFPLTPYSPAIALGSWLRTRCQFEAALKWYRTAFDPLAGDCTWVECSGESKTGNQPSPVQPPVGNLPNGNQPPVDGQPRERGGANQPPLDQPPINQPPVGVVNSSPSVCCDSTDVTCAEARNRSILLHYLETLRECGDAQMRKNSPEAFEQARVCFDIMRRVLGRSPRQVQLAETGPVMQVGDFKAAFPPLNPRLLDLYAVTEDRLGLIHNCLNAKRLRNGKLWVDKPYFGDNPLREGWRSELDMCGEEEGWCLRQSPYRFIFLIEKAKELTARAQELGSQLLAAYEKGDAEFLASLRSGHERELAVMGLEARKDQWRDADWQIEALQKTKETSQANLKYYADLIENGLINGEIAYQDLTVTSTVLRGVGNISEAIAEGVGSIPNTFTGVAGFGGTPLFYEQLPIGSPLASIFATGARIMNSLAEISSSTAGLELTEASWQRRNEDWVHQTQILKIEIQQLERQILGAQRRRDQALNDLNLQTRQIEQSCEVHDFVRDKFTAHNLYLFLQKETAGLYSRMYHMALHAARHAEGACNFELGHTTRRFFEGCMWDTLREGLLAGEDLDSRLRALEAAYLTANVREEEATKHVSLRLDFPMEYLRLRTTGSCDIEIPEWMFDLERPGMYMRRIKDVTITIPCVAGPFVGVHCRLTLLSSSTRIDPRLSPPANHCCCDGERRNDYEACGDDPRVVRQYAARESISTSSGKNDSGMFELNFRDERYLPFEYMGAVSRWRLELPRENNFFEVDTATDIGLRIDHTARFGGTPLQRAANFAAQSHLPGGGWVFFDVEYDFPDAWELFQTAERGGKESRRVLDLRLQRNLFPFLPNHPDLQVRKLALLVEVDERNERKDHSDSDCPCSEPERPDAFTVAFRMEEKGEGEHKGGELKPVTCVTDHEWPKLYRGEVETRFTPEGRHKRGQHARLEFPWEMGEIRRLYVFCRYTALHRRP